MFPHLEERRPDSRFVERVWRTASEREGAFTSISTVHWSIVVATLDGRVSVSRTASTASPRTDVLFAHARGTPTRVASTGCSGVTARASSRP
ncbi:MAG: hypothetical protein EA416_00585 [Trueperaceae bacterium]|nr:MAG: hypothetical protein EA416_00585 [Trueperaceae bacterium]